MKKDTPIDDVELDFGFTDFRIFREAFFERAERLVNFTVMCRHAIHETTAMPKLVRVMEKVRGVAKRNKTIFSPFST